MNGKFTITFLTVALLLAIGSSLAKPAPLDADIHQIAEAFRVSPSDPAVPATGKGPDPAVPATGTAPGAIPAAAGAAPPAAGAAPPAAGTDLNTVNACTLAWGEWFWSLFGLLTNRCTDDNMAVVVLPDKVASADPNAAVAVAPPGTPPVVPPGTPASPPTGGATDPKATGRRKRAADTPGKPADTPGDKAPGAGGADSNDGNAKPLEGTIADVTGTAACSLSWGEWLMSLFGMLDNRCTQYEATKAAAAAGSPTAQLASAAATANNVASTTGTGTPDGKTASDGKTAPDNKKP